MLQSSVPASIFNLDKTCIYDVEFVRFVERYRSGHNEAVLKTVHLSGSASYEKRRKTAKNAENARKTEI